MDVEPDTPTLSISSTPEVERAGIPVQPAFFYPSGHNVVRIRDEDQGFLSPDQDPLATRGIPVFKPTMDEFQDFEKYMERVEVWGRKSGIVKIIPPKEWSDSLPPTNPILPSIKLRHPIEQHMLGRGGLFRQSNVEKRKNMSFKDWAELCSKDDLKAPQVKDGTVKTRGIARNPIKSRRKNKVKVNSPDSAGQDLLDVPEAKDASLDADAAVPPVQDKDAAFYADFDPRSSWLPEDTAPEDYTPEACRELERLFWRTCGIGAPALYGADMSGTLFTDETKIWNVGHLPSFLSRLCARQALPGVNTPYLYFGMWRAAFAWHVEDMDLYSINYVHWGAPKYWYAIPSERSKAFEGVMKGYFPGDSCPQFLRHKSYLASPTLLTNSSCRPNTLVQHQGEFVITYPRGYHAGFNLGLNCAESVNFALENWIELGRKAAVCRCVGDSVTIDVDSLLRQAEVGEQEDLPQTGKHPLEDEGPTDERQPKRLKMSPSVASTEGPTEPSQVSTKHKIRIPPAPQTPCCLCASPDTVGLLPVHDPPAVFTGSRPPKGVDQHGNEVELWRAHEQCARAIPETWVDLNDGNKMVFGVDAIVRDRWNLKCSACTRPILKAHGAKVQCTKGKCPKSFHVSCAIASDEIGFRELEEVEKEIILVEPSPSGQITGLVEPPPTTAIESTAPHGPAEEHLGVPQTSSAGGSQASEPVGRVYKTIKKPNIELLCSQHNPVVLAQKKAVKLEQLRKDVLAFPPQSRIRIRVSAGVYEVTLVRVDEDRGTVIVEWTPGDNKEFRWGSIVWGQVPEGTILRKAESEMGPLKAVRNPAQPVMRPVNVSPPKAEAAPSVPQQTPVIKPQVARPAMVQTGQPAARPSLPTTSSSSQHPSTYSYASAYYPYPIPVHGYHWGYPASSSRPAIPAYPPGYNPLNGHPTPQGTPAGYWYYSMANYPPQTPSQTPKTASGSTNYPVPQPPPAYHAQQYLSGFANHHASHVAPSSYPYPQPPPTGTVPYGLPTGYRPPPPPQAIGNHPPPKAPTTASAAQASI